MCADIQYCKRIFVDKPLWRLQELDLDRTNDVFDYFGAFQSSTLANMLCVIARIFCASVLPALTAANTLCLPSPCNHETHLRPVAAICLLQRSFI